MLATVAIVAACGAPEPGTATLDGAGGDAWLFAKPVSGELRGACDEVVVASSRGTVIAAVDGDRFDAIVPLTAGDNQVTARCRLDGAERAAAPQPWRVRVGDRPRAVARLHRAGAGLRLEGDGSRPGPVRLAPVVGYRWTARAGNPAPIPGLPGDGRALEIEVPAVDGDYLVDLEVSDSDGVIDRAAVRFGVIGGEAALVDPTHEHPAWVDQAVVYGVSPFFFAGGELTDVVPRLDALVELGVTVLWLGPVMEAAEGDYGYATTDHFAVREDFGGEPALRALLDAAHARGLKVILDIVANHTSLEHPYVAATPDFYEHGDDGELTHYFDWEELPNLDHDQPEVTAWLVEAFAYWVRELGVDGFRADAAWGPAERSPGFWPAVRAELARIDPDVMMLAEASARDPYWFHHGFDVAYDWTWGLGEWAWRAAFDEIDARRLAAELTGAGDAYDPDARILRFLDNNDTGARFATRYGAARVPAAAAVLFTVPGVPALWTGSETGAALQPYDEGPALTWDDPHGLVAVYTRLATLRRTLPALRGGDLELVDVTPGDQVIAYLRGGAVLVIADLAGDGGPVSVAVTPAIAAMLGGGTTLRDAYHDADVKVAVANGRMTLTVAGDGVRILVPGG